MIKKILSYESKTLTGAALVLAFASLLSRIVGVARDRILAHQFGAGVELDMYTAAFRIPDFIYNLLIVGALSAGFIPLFLALFQKEKSEAWKFVSRVINATLLLIGLISLILYFFAPTLVDLLVPGFSVANKQTTLELTRIMLFSPLILGLSAVVSGVLQSLKAFFIYSLAPVLYNLGIIVGALFLVPHFGLKGLAYGVILGASFHLLIQIPVLLNSGFRYLPLISFKNKECKQLIRMMIPRTITLASVQITSLFITAFASLLGAGSIAIFNFANNISSLPIGIIGISFAVAVFPTLSKHANDGDMEEFRRQLSLTTRQVLFFILPLTALFILLRAQIVRVLLGTGEFNWEDTVMTATTVGMFSISLFSQCLLAVFSRAYFALHNTRTPLLIAIFSMVFTGLLGFVLKGHFGVPGLALAISLGSIFQVIFLWLGLKKILGTLEGETIFKSSVKIFLSCLALAGVTQFLKYPVSLFVNMDTFLGIFIQGLLSGISGLLMYGVLSYLLGLEEMQLFIGSLRKKWLKLRNISPEESISK